MFGITLGPEHPLSNMTKDLQHTSLINIYTSNNFSVLHQCELRSQSVNRDRTLPMITQ